MAIADITPEEKSTVRKLAKNGIAVKERTAAELESPMSCKDTLSLVIKSIRHQRSELDQHRDWTDRRMEYLGLYLKTDLENMNSLLTHRMDLQEDYLRDLEARADGNDWLIWLSLALGISGIIF